MLACSMHEIEHVTKCIAECLREHLWEYGGANGLDPMREGEAIDSDPKFGLIYIYSENYGAFRLELERFPPVPVEPEQERGVIK